MTPEIDQDLFNRNLLLTQVYCDLQLQKPFESNVKVLRSINPEINGQPIFSLDKVLFNTMSFCGTIWKEYPFEFDIDILYQNLFIKQLSFKSEMVSITQPTTTYKGKILVADVACAIPDGAAADESDFFIDDNDCPPIDTWFYLSKSEHGAVIFAWIPERFIDIVERAREVNALDIFYWYDDDFFERYNSSNNSKIG